jgi:putative hydrolase of the HAD superfamily
MKIFFDVDGVLIDGWHADAARRKPWDAELEEDLGVDRARFQKLFFRGDPSPMQDCVSGKRDLHQALAEVLPKTGYKGEVEEFIAYWLEKDANINEEVLAIAAELSALPGTELYIATGQEHRRAHHLWQTLGFENHFREMFYSARIGHLKPTLEFFSAINEALGISGNERPVFFDDTPQIVAVAQKAGWDAQLFETAEDIRTHPRVGPLLAQG